MKKFGKIRKIRNRKNGFSEKVFKYLKETSFDFLNLSAALIFDPKSIIKKVSYSNSNRSYSSDCNYYFKRSPYFKENNGKIFITTKGRLRIIKDILKDKLDKKAEWNGFWWAVAFDIPEKRKNARNLLRSELKSMHFVEVQKSIWVTPYNIEKELSALLKLWLKDLAGNIRVFKIEKIIDDTDLKKYFEIN